MHLINALRNFMGLPAFGAPRPSWDDRGLLNREQAARKVRARAANKRARKARRLQRLATL